MARTVQCIKLGQEAEGWTFRPTPGELGKRIWENVSKQAWADWLKHQTMLVNENRLNLADARARQYLARQMETTFWRRRRRCGGRPAQRVTEQSEVQRCKKWFRQNHFLAAAQTRGGIRPAQRITEQSEVQRCKKWFRHFFSAAMQTPRRASRPPSQ